MAYELGWEEIPCLTPGAVKTLEAYPWPGNIRELKNVIERAVYKSPSHRIEEISFDPFKSRYVEGLEPGFSEPGFLEADPVPAVSKAAGEAGDGQREMMADLFEKPLKEAIRTLEYHRLCTALSACRFNQKEAAALLGLSYDQLRGLKKKYGSML